VSVKVHSARLRVIAKSSACAAALLLQACVYVPRTTSYYDEQCRVTAREMTLERSSHFGVGGANCVNDSCVALLVAAGVVTAASVVVSGSVVVVGNVVYWLERRADCAERAG
jgi:hypothetical protein